MALAPSPLHSTTIRFKRLYHISPVGFMGAFAVGLGNGPFWSLAPLFATDGGLDFDGVAVFMSLVVHGGALGQYPLGTLSRLIDPLQVTLGASAGGALAGGMRPIPADHFQPGVSCGAF